MSTARKWHEPESIGSEPDLKTTVVADLEGLRQLPENWNGYGASPLDPDILESAADFVRSWPERPLPRPQVVPMTRGRVQLEWHQGRRSLELEFESPNYVHYLKWDPQAGIEEEGVIPAEDLPLLLGLIEWFAAGSPDE